MNFTKKSANLTPIEDNVFAVVKLAKDDIKKNGLENVVDATIGSLYDETGKIVAFHSVFNHYDQIPHEQKAKYASSFLGNEAYRKQVYEWVKQSEILNLHHEVIATPGGSGAISLTFSNILDPNETVIIPDIAWGSYSLMADQNNLNVETYQMFFGNKFNIDSFKEVVLKVKQTQNKILVVINDPCHNPTGYTMTINEWNEVIDFMNEVSKDIPCIILNDIAYIDYSYTLKDSRKYLNTFNKINNNLLCIVAFSISKSLTSYGLRCGAALALSKNPETTKEIKIVFEKSARAIWSNIPNAAMDNFVWVTVENIAEYMDEKQKYIDLLKERSDIFIKEAKECDLPLYPYKEGFFVTIKFNNNEERNCVHQTLIDNHIYTVCVNKGIRVAVCSTSTAKIKGLAKKIKQLI